MDEVTPWCRYTSGNAGSLRKIAGMLGAITADGSPAFGAAGQAIAGDLLDFCSWNDGEVEKKERAKGRSAAKAEADPRSAIATEIIEAFLAEHRDSLGVKSPDFSWGRATKSIYKAMDSGWDAGSIKALIPTYFACRKECQFLFKEGQFHQFISALVRLRDIQGEAVAEIDGYFPSAASLN